jgi:hypothetical protein
MKIAVLQQGKFIDDEITKYHKKIFTSNNFDFYRLNWFEEGDSLANFTKIGLCCSEGRAYLFDKVKNDGYDYYLFLDDDIIFNDENITSKITNYFLEYKPLIGTFLTDKWHMNWAKDKQKKIKKKAVFPIACYDMCVQFFKREFAELMFPPVIHGAHRAFWYASFICFKLYPKKQQLHSQIEFKNSRNSKQVFKNKENFHGQKKIMNIYNNIFLKKGFLDWDHDKVNSMNKKLFSKKPDKKEIIFTQNDFYKIINQNSERLKKRNNYQ